MPELRDMNTIKVFWSAKYKKLEDPIGVKKDKA